MKVLQLYRLLQDRERQVDEVLLREEHPQTQHLHGVPTPALDGHDNPGEGGPLPPQLGLRGAVLVDGQGVGGRQLGLEELPLVFGHGEAEEGHEVLQGGEGILAELVVEDEVEPEGRKEGSGIKTHTHAK